MATPSNTLKTFTCPTCGAPLEIKVTEPAIHCQFCGSVIDNPEYQQPQQVRSADQTSGTGISFQYTPSKSAQKKMARNAAGGIAFIGIITLIVGGAIFFTLFRSSGTGGGGSPATPLQVYKPAILLNTGSSQPDLIASTSIINKKSYAISRLDLANHKVLWSALEQESMLNPDSLIANDTMAYLVFDDRLVALQLSDGKKAWEATLPDKLMIGTCQACVHAVNGQVVVLTADHSLSAYDALTGHQSWEKKLGTTNGPLTVVGSAVAVAYMAENGSDLSLFDAASGSEVIHLAPTCQPKGTLSSFGDELNFYSNIVFDTTHKPAIAYTFYGLFNACVQAWDLSNGDKLWETIEDDHNLDNARDNPILLANGKLYYVQENQLRSLDAATGQNMTVLADIPDYSLVPLFNKNNRLVVRAMRTTGSRRFELWAYDLNSGKSLWKRPVLNAEPIDPPDTMAGLVKPEGSAWTIYQSGADYWLMIFQAKPNQAAISRVNLDTGELLAQKNVLFGNDSILDFYGVPSWIKSQDNLAWFQIETEIYAIDPNAGAIAFRWE